MMNWCKQFVRRNYMRKIIETDWQLSHKRLIQLFFGKVSEEALNQSIF